jgi:hypothetical protein
LTPEQVVARERRPFVGQSPPLAGRPSFEAGGPDSRGLIEGPTIGETEDPIAVRKHRESGAARQRWGASFEAPYWDSAVRVMRSPYIPCM